MRPKHCRGCDQYIPAKRFGSNAQARDGKNNYCKCCARKIRANEMTVEFPHGNREPDPEHLKFLDAMKRFKVLPLCMRSKAKERSKIA